MKSIVITVIICLGMVSSVTGQVRKNAPEMLFSEEPIGQLEENIAGWTYSLDGRWLEEKT